jgi:hypothetical protein
MNPTYVNRNEFIQKLKLNTKRETKPVWENKLGDNKLEEIIKPIDSTRDDIDNSLSLDIKTVLPSIRNIHCPYCGELRHTLRTCIGKVRQSKPILYTYKLPRILSTNPVNIKSEKLVNLCIFNIIENNMRPPFILYLLNKDEKTNILYFPHFYTTDNILDAVNENINKIFNSWSSKPQFKGYLETRSNIYMFYEQKYAYNIEKLEYKDIWWWTSIFEILNIKTVLNFSIHRTVYSMFYKKPILISLFDINDEKILIPYIGYFGSYYTYVTFIATFGIPKQGPMSNLGPYYYFNTYHGAGRWAIWSASRKSMIVNNETITSDDSGVYKRGGIVRFAVFGLNMKYFLNRKDDPEDKSKISQELAEKVPFIKNTLKIRDVDGKWADNYDMAYIGSTLIKSDDHPDRRLSIQIAVRDYYQQMALSYHYVDTEEFRNIEGTIKKREVVYGYKDYNIV